MKHLKKISKKSIKKISSTLVVIFFMMVILFQKDVAKNQMQFVWNTDETFMHNAANQQRDYLFENEGGQQIYQGTLGTGGTTGTITTGNTISGGYLDENISPTELEQIIKESTTGIIYTGTSSGNTNTGIIYTGIDKGNINSGNINSGNINSGNINTGNINSGNINTGNTTTGFLDCITPWGKKVINKDFVLAYEQRKDVSTICNIEKRICTDGVLGGSFKQYSCKENVEYIYRKAEIISYNQKVLNEYIQPADPIHSGADFSNQGKIDTLEKPTDKRGTSNNEIVTKKEINQTKPTIKANCTTPREQTINHGQFIKAYKAPRGFIDFSCEVEIRACINGNLKGTFSYSKCTFNNTTYSDYLKAGSPISNTGFLFFQRIKSVFRR